MHRRKFLQLAAASSTCSVLVNLNGWTATNPTPDNHDARNPHPGQNPTPAPAPSPEPVEPHMTLVDLDCDLFVAGGGMAGVCAAVAAARRGARVILVQDRSRLGGNSSSEVKMHIVGADIHGGRPGWREGGLIEEFRLDDAVGNPQRSRELWDLLLYDKLVSEPNVTFLLDTTCCAAVTRDNLIQHVLARCDKTEHLYRIRAGLYADCTGDSRLALEAGADIRTGREAGSEFDESLGLEHSDNQTLGSSILFTSRDYGQPMPFTPPAWARKVTRDMLRFRPIRTWEYGYWWIEWGGHIDPIRDNERIRFELLAIALGVWDHIKNSGDHPSSQTWALDWLGMIPGKRGSRRVLGDHILTENDLMGRNPDFPDAVCIGGWGLDDHPPHGFDRPDLPPFRTIPPPYPYNIPLRSLYSRNIRNLLMAGRNISATHVAFTSTRVMATCAVIGQAVGTAAAHCVTHALLPRQLAGDPTHVEALQQSLLRDDQTIRDRRNNDPLDLARSAEVLASGAVPESDPASVINGLVRDMPGQWTNRWGAPMTSEGPSIDLEWTTPQTLRLVQITFDTGFHRELTLTHQDSYNARMIRAPQPETVRDYELLYRPPDRDDWIPLGRFTDNHQRLRRHSFEPFQARALRLHVLATNGSDTVRVFEIRCYA
jgi:hypothetical protein